MNHALTGKFSDITHSSTTSTVVSTPPPPLGGNSHSVGRDCQSCDANHENTRGHCTLNHSFLDILVGLGGNLTSASFPLFLKRLTLFFNWFSDSILLRSFTSLRKYHKQKDTSQISFCQYAGLMFVSN